MKLETFRTFLAIAEHGSFAAAARALAMSQSAVSTQMKKLESELKAELFDRSKRPPILNDVGKLAVAKVRTLTSAYETLQMTLVASEQVEGRIRLGAVGSTLASLVPIVLAAMRRSYPHLHIEIVSGFTDQLLRQVDNRSLDAAIISDFDSSIRDICWRPFLRERIILIAPPDAPSATPKQLAQTYAFIRYSPVVGVGRVIDMVIQKSQIQVQEIMRLDTIDAVESMVYHGHGISIIPDQLFHSDKRLNIRHIDIGSKPYYRILGIISPNNSKKHNLIDVLFLEIMNQVKEKSS